MNQSYNKSARFSAPSLISSAIFSNKYETNNESNGNLSKQSNLPQQQPYFSSIRLNQWHTNEEIFNILTYCNRLLNESNLENTKQKLLVKEKWLSNQVKQRPTNGSVFLFDRRIVKNFKKDGFLWKRRKTGGANSVREDRMCLKVTNVFE
jgi:hypothetical protein